MIEALIIGVLVLAVATGFWLTRNAKGPTSSEVIIKAAERNSRISPMGEPTDWERELKPPED